MGRPNNSPKKNILSKKANGGVLNAAEKRRRMLEAGKRFLMKSVHRLSPARASGRGRRPLNTNQSTSKLNTSTVAQVVSSRLRGRNENLPLYSFATPILRSKTNEGGDYSSCDEEVFRKDEKSLSEILNHRPISFSAGRPSQLSRQNRPSLFPNGVNPIDEAISARKLVPPKKPPRTFKETHNQEQVPEVLKDENKLCGGVNVESFASSSKKSSGKSVRFAETCMAISPSRLHEKNSPLVKEWMQLFERVNDAELEEILRSIPKETFQRLYCAVNRIETGARSHGAKRLPFFVNINKCEPIKEDEDSFEDFDKVHCSSKYLEKSFTPLRSCNKKFDSLSEVRADRKATHLVNEVEEQQINESNQSKNRTLSQKASDKFSRPTAENTPPNSTFVPYNLRSSPAVRLGSPLEPKF